MIDRERQYEPLDLGVLSNKKSRIISSSEALKDVIAPEWVDDVLQGRKKVTVSKVNEQIEDSTCVK